MSRMDALDIKILESLQRKGRMSNAEMADKVNLSPSACHRRIQRLENEGVIRDYVALLNPRAVDKPSTIFVEITLSGQADELLDALDRKSTRLNSSHVVISYAVFFLKKKKKTTRSTVEDKTGSQHDHV